jgi:hypothetical protein
VDHPLENDDDSYPWFTPTRETKRKWLATRKGSYQAGSFQAPGFFDTDSFQLDSILFSSAVLLEAVGLVAFYAFFDSIIFAMLFFVLDFIFAIGSHWNKSRWVMLKNQLAIINRDGKNQYVFGEDKDRDSNGDKSKAAKIHWRQKSILTFKILAGLFYSLIIGIAVFKVVGFMQGWSATGESFGVIPLLIAITYAIVAFIHIYATGYYFAELFFRRAIKKEKFRHMMTHAHCVPPGPPLYLETHIHLPNGLTMNRKIPHERHYLINDILYTFGVITDDQIRNICNALPDNPVLKEVFLLQTLHHQIYGVMSITPMQGPPTCMPHVPLPPPMQPNVQPQQDRNWPQEIITDKIPSN